MKRKCRSLTGFFQSMFKKGAIDPCRYETQEVWKNTTVMVLRCKKCGHQEVVWYLQDNSELIGSAAFDASEPVPIIGRTDG